MGGGVNINASTNESSDFRWFVRANGTTFGPYNKGQMEALAKNGRLADDTSVAHVGEDTWCEASEDRTLKYLFEPLPPIACRSLPPKRMSSVSASGSATVVQVTNQIAPPAFLLDGGIAKSKSAGTALLLSLFVCGVGQMYNGQIGKGLLMLISCLLLWVVLLGWIINIWSVVDAYATAKNMNLRYHQRLVVGALGG